MKLFQPFPLAQALLLGAAALLTLSACERREPVPPAEERVPQPESPPSVPQAPASPASPAGMAP